MCSLSLLCVLALTQILPAPPPPPPPLTHSLHSQISHSLTHSLTPLTNLPLTHSLTHSLTPLTNLPLTHSLTHSTHKSPTPHSLTHSTHISHSLTHSHTHTVQRTGYACSSVFRFMTSTGEWTWVQMEGTLRFMEGTREPKHLDVVVKMIR